jgi:hypothetical protein
MTVGMVAQTGIAHEMSGTMIAIGIIIKIASERRRRSRGMSGPVIVIGVTGIGPSALDHRQTRTILVLKGTHDDGDVRNLPRERNTIQAVLRELVLDAASKTLTSYFLYERTTVTDDQWMVKVLNGFESQ